MHKESLRGESDWSQPIDEILDDREGHNVFCSTERNYHGGQNDYMTGFFFFF